MHGTVAKKGNRWYAVVYEGLDDAGKQKRRWISAGTRKADAERVLADLIRKKHEGEPLVTPKGTFGDYLTERWLPVQQSRVRRSTYDSYLRNIEFHVLPALGRRQLAKLTARRSGRAATGRTRTSQTSSYWSGRTTPTRLSTSVR